MTDIWHVMGLRGTGSDKYSVTDLFVPEAFVAARDDDSTRREDGVLYRFSSLQLYASGFAGVAMGIARSALDAFIELARDKVPFRGKTTLRDNNVVQSAGRAGRGALAIRPRLSCTGRSRRSPAKSSERVGSPSISGWRSGWPRPLRSTRR